jgi:hypothetical protein
VEENEEVKTLQGEKMKNIKDIVAAYYSLSKTNKRLSIKPCSNNAQGSLDFLIQCAQGLAPGTTPGTPNAYYDGRSGNLVISAEQLEDLRDMLNEMDL